MNQTKDKQIVIDYKEYLQLKEKAELNQEEIKRKVNEIGSKFQNQLEKDYKEMNEVREKYKKEDLFDEIIKRVDKHLNLFNYLKYEDVVEVLTDVLLGGLRK